jgi:hypothetical protein
MRGSVAETFDALLDAEVDGLCRAREYEFRSVLPSRLAR